MTRPRIVDAGATLALSRRTTRRHFLLNPDEARQMEQIYWYCLAYAAKLHGVHQDAELAGAEAQDVEIELSDSGVRAKEVVTTKGAPGDHHGAARHDEAGLGHALLQKQEVGQVAPVSFQPFAQILLPDILDPTTHANVGRWVDGCQRMDGVDGSG